jgi:hypothetical protein
MKCATVAISADHQQEKAPCQYHLEMKVSINASTPRQHAMPSGNLTESRGQLISPTPGFFSREDAQ